MLKSKESFYENEEDASAAFMSTMEDIVQSINVAQGEPYVGKTGKAHPIYDVTLNGTSTERRRAFRFAVFREYHQSKVEKSGFSVNAKFPKTYTKSSFGIKMSPKEVEQRCRDLDIYMKEIYDRRNEWPPKLKDATLTLLKLDEGNVFGKARAPTVAQTIRQARDQVNSELAAETEEASKNWSRTEAAASMLAKAKLVHKRYPTNRTARAVVGLEAWYRELKDEEMKRLIACTRSGLDHPSSELGCYAMQPSDYETLGMFFDRVCNDYHNNPNGDKVHTTNWQLDSASMSDHLPSDGVLDVRNIGISEPVSMRVRVGRNLTNFPLPGAMTKEDRIKFELTMLKAFEQLIKDVRYGGQVYSLTPHQDWEKITGVAQNPNFMNDVKYNELVKAHVMFKDMSNDPFLKSAGISSDWPCGRGCYQSADGGFIIWFGEEDQLRIMCMTKGFILNEVFDRLKQALEVVEAIDGVKFATSKKYGYVTSCPSNLGTGMRASLHIKLPHLCSDGTDTKAKAIAKPLGLSVRGLGGEHTPIGEDGTVDLSPSQRLFITEGDIIGKLYQGVKLLLEKEAEHAPPKNQALLFLKPHANTPEVLSVVKEHLELCGVDLIASGAIDAAEINRKKLIDRHYYAIASKASILKPQELSVPNDKFAAQFGLSWTEALNQGNVYNALDACEKLGLSGEEMDAKWGECKQAKQMVKLGGGFYCGLIGGLYVFNGFFMAMRAKYTAEGAGITWLSVEWDSSTMSWSDFRSGLLGATDPTDAPSTSLRGMVRDAWSSLQLPSPPNVGDNGVHGSASPFEAMCERLNWCADNLNLKSVADDVFGAKLLASGIPLKAIEAWMLDPQVALGDGTTGSLFDALEDLNALECLHKCLSLYEVQSALEGSIIVRMNPGAYGTQHGILNGSESRYAVMSNLDSNEENLPRVSFTSSRKKSRTPRRFIKLIQGCDRCNDLSVKSQEPAFKAAVSEAIERNNRRKGLTTVEDLCDKRKGSNGQDEYLIKWQGFADMLWMTPDNIPNASELILEFEEALKKSALQEEAAAEAARSALRNDQLHASSGGSDLGVSEEFKEAIENGLNLVKFNRKGQAAFRTVAMMSADDTILSWRPTKKEGLGARIVRSTFKGESIDLRSLKDVRNGEAEDPETGGEKWGTSTLRMYVQKNSHGVKMLGGGITFCLVFNGRSLDFGADSTAQRDFLVAGFKALQRKIQASHGIAEE